jgi:hypothetical protein
MWESPSDWTDKFFKQELEAHVPKVQNLSSPIVFPGMRDILMEYTNMQEILQCKEVSREVNFTSAEKMVQVLPHPPSCRPPLPPHP